MLIKELIKLRESKSVEDVLDEFGYDDSLTLDQLEDMYWRVQDKAETIVNASSDTTLKEFFDKHSSNFSAANRDGNRRRMYYAMLAMADIIANN